ncbi:mobilisation protein [Streptococcus suis]|uniref:Mobilisation protein n=1 Tax=Streptococcus suis TaxID=1307 RepID=A0A0Z8H921_STRSU|nr:plasmid mobilization relaxosome protein MobC [Streptococcus suis]NQH36331.1 plasmid mobilization relaxosome protein MobC [Streptococcus suis]NQN11240.1 plasmid mobilization relaxosome protein MobC [Streptococcus suis]CYV12826.1 mobilisation protein [Streptococcus suis]HEL1626075.1 plasmid mobilization relaxosome protein MobC [Streptococcus suis]HEM3213541.1 plasmid mobilization relaxosome protein MobC [Streptococcus suis 12814]
MAKRFRGILKNFYVTQEENQLLNHRVKTSRHKDFSSYARHILLHPRTKEVRVDTSSLESVSYEIKRLGNNLNQIVKVVHQTGHIGIEQMAEVEKIFSELDHLVRSELKLPPSQLLKKYGGREE